MKCTARRESRRARGDFVAVMVDGARMYHQVSLLIFSVLVVYFPMLCCHIRLASWRRASKSVYAWQSSQGRFLDSLTGAQMVIFCYSSLALSSKSCLEY